MGSKTKLMTTRFSPLGKAIVSVSMGLSRAGSMFRIGLPLSSLNSSSISLAVATLPLSGLVLSGLTRELPSVSVRFPNPPKIEYVFLSGHFHLRNVLQPVP